MKQPEALAPMLQILTNGPDRQTILMPARSVCIRPAPMSAAQCAMGDGQQQAVLGNQAGWRGFRQGTDLAGTFEQLQQAEITDTPILQAHRQPWLIE
ncbi:hypothetical protein D9M69_659060 [compost metagenome]